MNHWQKILIAISVIFLLTTSDFIDSSAKYSDETLPVVRAVLFYSPTCGHCQKLIMEDLPPITEKYGDQLNIIGINVATKEGQDLYQQLVQAWGIPQDRVAVPTLVVSDIYLVGGNEIPEQFPKIIDQGLSEGGIDWPEIPGFDAVINQIEESQEAQSGGGQSEEESPTTTVENKPPENVKPTIENEQLPTYTETESTSSGQVDSTMMVDESSTMTIPFDQEITMFDLFKQDLAGNTLAVVVLAGMIISVAWVLVLILSTPPIEVRDWSWLLPILSIIGIFVAGYLTFVEVTETEAVCGPIGNCNAVQKSPYATIFGILPVGVLGLIGYIAILAGWLLKKIGPDSWGETLTLFTWGMSLFGVIFSIYLTYLEPFVIGATCAWCISSALIITFQFWAATNPVRLIWADSDEDPDLEADNADIKD